MPRQTISFSDPNHAWLASKIESREFRSKSEVVNDALRKIREMENGIEAIRAKLLKAEQSGFTSLTAAQILEKSKAELRVNGELKT